jgi:cell fate regulator YaaT (PSP1 superfamily)
MSEQEQLYGNPTDILCACGKPVEMSPNEAEAYLEAKSHFPSIAPPKCKGCRETRAV